ncbi:MAG: hypothetical protein WC506_05510 [Candidatus Micrarchaeia archaeon]
MKNKGNSIPALYGTVASMSRTIAASPSSTAFRLCTKVSPKTLALVLSRTKAKKLYVSKTIRSSLSPGIRRALKRVGVALVDEGNQPGRLKTRSVMSRFARARKLAMHGMDVAKACAKVGMPRRTYYYVLKSRKA